MPVPIPVSSRSLSPSSRRRTGRATTDSAYPYHMVVEKRPSRRTKAEAVYDALQSAILSGNLPPGEHLRQEEVAAQWGVSQTPVREAFRRLESEGLVEHAANRGVVVRGIPWAPPAPPLDVLARRWQDLIADPESLPGTDFP